jgi:hypothetical protein
MYKVYAKQAIPSANSSGIYNPATSFGQGDGGIALGNLIAALWRTLITLGGIALLLYFVWGGAQWILAGGDKGKIEEARNRITQSIIGMAVLAGSVAIMYFLREVFQVDLLNPQF